MYETLDLPVGPFQAAALFGLLVGLAFGALAEVTRFCLRRAVAGAPGERLPAAGVWAAALLTALLGTQAAVLWGFVDFSGHRFMAGDVPVLAIVLGGLLFGVGMVLTRGCISRLTVLSGTGNLRAATVLVIFAIVAHSTMKGVLAPLRTALGSVTATFDPALPLAAAAVLALGAAALALRSGARPLHLALAGLLGLLVPLAWVGTGFVLFDEFDPIPMESLSFTLPSAEALFWSIAGTSVPAGFGVGLVGGTLVGALVLALLGGRFAWASFETPRQTGRYALGAAMMGFGGVLAGGCTLGAGLAGVPTLSAAALLALASIVAGGWAAGAALGRREDAAARPTAIRPAVPAE